MTDASRVFYKSNEQCLHETFSPAVGLYAMDEEIGLDTFVKAQLETEE